ncbi:hypothetical protein LTT02_28445 [Mycolicibacterium smegmatis]|uniref:hypothetical protein n=1 Tax=Mycolicibacterium smegmatis TaxID=1772 RepID=UPI0005DA496E|nr:hypothetical protein [Mycolicibacterium smegmatis]MDF1899943.1 hypothetical protein [Mycolicibacterium smegmatis]MDF1906661.1 hypothetical protein [Mycolicibacterium smegmatis]MDF1916140.1 hypothetical protein [Mycolicibacterium smegmatis]MDF1925123.1 hypothetical protein [Mycolicibacterium smegmatis]UAK56546.1 hypothetical protein K8P01_07345 [Mycolicibacterium smegmatis]
MSLSTADRLLIESMKQREFNLKKRQRAANAIFHETRRYRVLLVATWAVVVAGVMTGVCVGLGNTLRYVSDPWRMSLVVFAVGSVFGALSGAGWVRTPAGEKLLANKERRLHHKYGGDLHAGRRWQQFYHRGEDISVYIGQILYVVDSEQRFECVDDALAFVKAHSGEIARFRQRGLEMFNAVVTGTTLLVVSSVNERGEVSSRFMRFVKTDRPGVWFVTTSPDSPKVREFDSGAVALITVPNADGATISSNRVRIARSGLPFGAIAGLYRDQVPEYLDGMTEQDQRRELVYELTLESAKIDTWVDHELVVFNGSDSV